jgi:hypothetical protein
MSPAEERGETSAPTVSRFHSRLKQRPGEAFLVVRALAMSLGPDVTEKVSDSSVSYLRRDRPFLTVHAQKARLNLAFPREAILEDPTGRLLKRGDERYVALDGPEGVDGHTQEFVRKAYTALR